MASNHSDRKRAGGGTQLAEPPAAAAATETPESLDKVRDILFGGQMRAVETRIQGLEERLLREQQARVEELKHLGAELREAIRAMEKATSADLGKLSDRLSAELARSHQELKATKTDSAALATLFTDLASRLSGGTEKNGRRG